MSAGNWLNNVGSALSKAVEQATTPGKVARSNTATSASRVEAKPSDGLTEGGRRNVQDMLQAGMMAVAEKVEHRFDSVERSNEEMKVTCAQLEARLSQTEQELERQRSAYNELRQDLTDSKANFDKRISHVEQLCTTLDEQFRKLGDMVDKLITPTASADAGQRGSQLASAQAPNANTDDVPYHMRVVAKIGGFPYDTAADEMLKKCRDGLAAAQVDESCYKHLHCPRDKGSWCVLTFDTRKLLRSKIDISIPAH